MALLTAINLKNTTGSTIEIPSLGISISSAGVDDLLSLDNPPNQIFEDDNIRALIESGDLVVRFEGVADLSVADSLLLWDCRFNRPTERQSGAPTVNDDVTKGFTEGNFWFASSTGKLYVCVDDSSGAAVWDLLN